MKYALNIDKETNRILSATYEKYAHGDMPIVENLPDGDISNYLFKGGQYEYSPLQKEHEVKYEQLIEQYIRERYSVSQELAILRQKDQKPDEYLMYYDYCEACKRRAKAETSDTQSDTETSTSSHFVL